MRHVRDASGETVMEKHFTLDWLFPNLALENIESKNQFKRYRSAVNL